MRPKMARCETFIYRGEQICKHSLHKHEAVAAQSGSSFKLDLIQGSYTNDNDLSKGTHGGGGVTDHEYDGYSWTIASAVSRLYRKNMILEWIRWWKNNHHGHGIDPECPNLSPEAVAQFVEFINGGDGLVGDLKDPGDRTHAEELATLFRNRRSNKSRVKLIQRGLGLYIDGVWGPQTDKAISTVRTTKLNGVRAVQTGLLVDADGQWGPVTESAYVKLRAAVYTTTTLTTTVKPTTVVAPPRPSAPPAIPGSVYTGSKSIDVSKVRPNLRNEYVRRFNGLLWAWLCRNSPNYARANISLWMKESSNLYGTQAQRATQEMYRVLNARDPKSFNRVSLPTWPGWNGVKAIGGSPF